METPRSVLLAVRRNDWLFSLDLKDAYLQVPIHPQSRHLLRICWEQEVWQFKALCFGLTTAPQVFTRLMAPVGAAFHKRGIRMVRYLDDWLFLSSSEQGAIYTRDVVLRLCNKLGIQINLEKSTLIPSQVSIYLGMKIDSSILKAFPTQDRIQTIQECIKLFLTTNAPPAKLWMRLIGLLSSLILLVPRGRRRIRPLQHQLHNLWDQEDHHFQVQWTETIRQSNLVVQSSELESRSSIVNSSSRYHVVFRCFGFRMGGINRGPVRVRDMDSTGIGGIYQLERTQSNTACSLSLQPSVPFKSRRSVRRQLDGYFLHKEGRRDEVPEAGQSCPRDSGLGRGKERDTHASVHHGQGERDSRCSESKGSDLKLRMDHSSASGRRFGSSLASNSGYVCHRNEPQTSGLLQSSHRSRISGTDAMLQDWRHLQGYAFPPFPLIRNILNKLRESTGCSLTLVTPFWPQKDWFVDLLELSVDTPRRLPVRRDLLKQPHRHVFHLRPQALQLTAWRLSADLPGLEESPGRWPNKLPSLEDLPLV
ncbi:uncharacterized protein [Palaemon carinicauda]|uniref:uncharacterized protein n=1 Tax=Palaemon carinicauda TaxID=392227 RepID=UPI0035B5A1D4